MDIGELESKKLSELRDIGRDMKIAGHTTMKKQDLVFRIMQADAESSGFHFRGGVLEIVEDDKQTMGFLRSGAYLPGKD
ncbi:MAG TPA: Rho termination factor N-terminal domain-containing protein, partial [Promineifilum sp.]|nr:Rho termination factor N-terminal domain-containing protein [Promineifilum sp.]